MSCDVDIKYQNDMILVSASGEANYSERFEMISDIVAACKKHNCYNVLAKANLAPMKLITAHDHVKIYESVGMTKKYRIAWFVEDPKALKNVEYAAAVLRNRNLVKGYVFSDYDEAKQWLISNSD